MRCLRSVLCLTLLVSAPAALAQAPAAGKLLVSNPGFDDPDFAESVLLILVHEDRGSAAIFLNRPTWIQPVEAFPEVEGLKGYADALYLGGPVAPGELLTLFEQDGTPPGNVLPIGDDVYFSSNPLLLSDMDFAAENAPRARVFAGRAEWGPGQLTREIAAGNWRVVAADPAYLFDEDPTTLWQRIPLTSDGVTASLH